MAINHKKNCTVHGKKSWKKKLRKMRTAIRTKTFLCKQLNMQMWIKLWRAWKAQNLSCSRTCFSTNRETDFAWEKVAKKGTEAQKYHMVSNSLVVKPTKKACVSLFFWHIVGNWAWCKLILLKAWSSGRQKRSNIDLQITRECQGKQVGGLQYHTCS